jgi:hypothetical protein
LPFNILDVAEGFFVVPLEGFAELGALVPVVEGFYQLLEAHGDEQADDDGGDVNEEVSPGAGGVVGRVDVEHGRPLQREFPAR